MPRVGLTTGAVITAAIELIDAAGPEALTLAAVAGRVGVATPSLYKHVRGLPELRRLVGARIMGELADRLGAATVGRGTDDAVAAFLHAYRAYAVAHPHRYAALPQAPETDPELGAAGERAVHTVLAVLRGYDLTGSDAIHATRCLRAAAHGFAALEIAGAFGLPEDIDETYDRFTAALTTALTVRSPAPTEATR